MIKAENTSDFSVLSIHDHHHHHYYYYYYRYTVSVNGEIAPWACSVMASSRALIIPMGALGAAMPMTKQSTLTQLENPLQQQTYCMWLYFLAVFVDVIVPVLFSLSKLAYASLNR